jgi:hypothetical protein
MISTRVHGIIDYVVAAILILAPFVLGFSDGTAAQAVPLAIAVLTIIMSLLTRYELAVVRVIPMVGHLAVDVLAGIVLLASPWLFNFADRIWWPHVVFGIAYIVIPLLTARKSPLETAAASPRA